MTARPGAVVVVGVGNSLRGDDAAGLEVARRLAAEPGDESVVVLAHEGEPVDLLEMWDGASAVVLVDALSTGGHPGAVHRFDASRVRAPAHVGGAASTHALGLTEAVELARTLDRLPARVTLFGVEGGDFATGQGLSPEVTSALPALVAAVRREARALAAAGR
jgi:hydrogenase maturation protease